MSDEEEIAEILEHLEMIEGMETEADFDKELGLDEMDRVIEWRTHFLITNKALQINGLFASIFGPFPNLKLSNFNSVMYLSCTRKF